RPAILVLATPLVVGTLFGPRALAGVLAGSLVSGLVMALASSNAGGAWDNAKKYIESGQHGGKGSDVHKAAVVGDTVGDPFKDTAGPALNPMIKVMNLVGILAAPFAPASITAVSAARIVVVVLSISLLAVAVVFSKRGAITE